MKRVKRYKAITNGDYIADKVIEEIFEKTGVVAPFPIHIDGCPADYGLELQKCPIVDGDSKPPKNIKIKECQECMQQLAMRGGKYIMRGDVVYKNDDSTVILDERQYDKNAELGFYS